jgi:dienelactone hydrolase
MKIIRIVLNYYTSPLLLLAGILTSCPAMAQQKPVLDKTVFRSWLSLADGQGISSNGKYVFYQLQASSSAAPTRVLQQLGGSWKAEFPGAGQPQFTRDSRLALFMQGKDSLCLFSLGSEHREYIPGVNSFSLFCRAKNEWLLYKIRTKLILRRIGENNVTATYDDVNQYLLTNDGAGMVLVQDPGEKTDLNSSISWVDMTTNKTKQIWQGSGVSQLVIDKNCKQLIFASDREGKKTERSFWYYNVGMKKADLFIEGSGFKEDTSLVIDQVTGFTTDNKSVFLLLKEKHKQEINPDNVQVDIWTYRDPIIQSEQLLQLDPIYYGEKTNRVVMRLADRSTLFRQEKEQAIDGIIPDSWEGDDLILVNNSHGDPGERDWFSEAKPSYDLIALKNGKTSHLNYRNPAISPSGRFVTGQSEGKEEGFCCFDRMTGRLYNIAASIPVSKEFDIDLNYGKSIWTGIWLPGNDTSLLVFDKYDVWLVDPKGSRNPVNMINGYGRRNHIEFRLPDNNIFYLNNSQGEQELLLSAFDLANKNGGFFSASLKGARDPTLLSLGPFDYKPGFFGPYVIKAKEAGIYLVKRGSCNESLNWFSTTDFKKFDAVSDIHPERAYNWMRSELITFKTTDGQTRQAVIYKPEDFDSSKKYPVILHYYEEKSANLNKYQAIYGNDAMDFSIAWMVSHGYIVVTPDILNYKAGRSGQVALQTVLGVTSFLEKLPWVDSKHIGLQGESFGGFETNYIITHSHRFRAAISSSGLADDVVGYDNLLNQAYWEKSQGRMSGSLFEFPQYYIENSPVLMAANITTPILTIANKNDHNVPFTQGLEWYMGLRRLGKKIWMLQYDAGGHGLLRREDLVDFILRSQQFFDFYLKGAPAPKWMVEGIPASLKRIDNGLELEPAGIEPGPGLLTPEEQKKVDSIQHRKPITITIP